MEILITKCSSPNYWYSDDVGRKFVVLGTQEYDGELEFLTEGNDYSGLVGASDCEIIIKGHRFALVPKAIDPTESPSDSGSRIGGSYE